MFTELGFFKDFYLGNKFLGSAKCRKPKSRIIGYAGRTEETFSEDIILDNGKTVKAGWTVITMIYPLNGKKI